MSEPLRYELDLSRPGHELHMRLLVPHAEAGALRLYMPRWAPGSYLLREFARHLDAIRATSRGVVLPARKEGTDAFVVEVAAAGPVEVTYLVYAHELTVRTNYLGSDRALISGAATWLVPEGRERSTFRVRVSVPEGWPAAECALPRDGDDFMARDFDALVDSPIGAGPAQVGSFVVRGVPHRIVVHGEGDARIERLTRDTKAICEAAASVFGEVPCPQYLFLVEQGCGGGLEHADSSVCGVSPLAFASDAEARRALSLFAHEYFHLWNVKRIRPEALGPFDYRREAHTPHLWVAEGLTSYYQHLLCLRAGLVDPGRFLAILASYVMEIESSTGETFQSLEEASHDAWIKYYRPHENSPNTQVSYYVKGCVAGLVLDLEVRRRTSGRRSLDDMFRALWALWKRRPERGFSDAELRTAFAEAAGEPLDALIEEVARSARRLDVDSRLHALGLEIVRRPARPGAFLGIQVKRSEGRLVVDRVLRGSPAWTAGLAPGEEVVAIDSFRVDEADLRSHLDERSPGTPARLTTSLWSKLREVPVALGERPSLDYRFRKRPDVGAAGKAALEAWLGVSHERLVVLDEPPEDQRGRTPRPL
jgi:predicted metalloprotease with PDZ domain